jgi:hypothetical protein
MDTNNILKINSVVVNQQLVLMFEDLLERAKHGEIRTFVGTGFLNSHEVITVNVIHNKDDIFKLLGAVVNLQKIIHDEIE